MLIECTSKQNWLDTRAQFITATEVSTLFSMNPYASARKMLEAKRCPVFIDNIYMTLGKVLEPAVVKAVELELGLQFEFDIFGGLDIYVDREKHLSATPDALGKSTLLECKSTSLKNYEENWEEIPPLYYMLQVHVQLICTGKKSGYLAVIPTDLSPEHFHDTLKLKVYLINRSADLESLLVETVARGYEAYINETDFERDFANNKRMAGLLNTCVERIL